MIEPVTRSNRRMPTTWRPFGPASTTAQSKRLIRSASSRISALGRKHASGFTAGHEHASEPWLFEAATSFIQNAGDVTDREAHDEVLRYLSWPSQAIGYKLGERAWLAAREQAKANSSAMWDPRVWHSKALALGPMSLDRLTIELAQLGNVTA